MAGELPADERLRRLWERLAPEHWPLPLEALPPDSALVGGAVRDALLGRLAERPDLDLVVPTDAIALARGLARRLGGTCVVLDPQRDIARLVLRGWTLDLAAREGSSLEEDLRRRDYTANALALPLTGAGGQVDPPGTLVDPTGGLADLAAGRLAAVCEANLLDDPLRLLRGVRLSSELAMPLDSRSQAWISRHAPRLARVAGERVLAELEKLAQACGGEQGLRWCLDQRLLEPWGIDPGAGPALSGLTLNGALERGLGPDETGWALPLARLATLLPPPALGRLRSSRRRQQQSERLRRWWGRLEDGPLLEGLAEPERLQLHQELESELPALLLRLPLAAAREAMQRWRQPHDPLYHPRAPLDGQALQQALGLAPGPRLGELLRHLTRERAFGRIPGEDPDGAAVAIDTALAWLSQRHD